MQTRRPVDPPPPKEQEISIRWRMSRRDLDEIAQEMAKGGGLPVRLQVRGHLEISFREDGEVDVRASISVVRKPGRSR